MLFLNLCYVLLLLLLAGEAPGSGDFVVDEVLGDGEHEAWINYKGLTAKETSYVEGGDGLVLREVTDGHRFVQMIYNGEGRLLDCEDRPWGAEVEEFVEHVQERSGNSTGLHALDWLDMHKLRGACRSNHRAVRRKARALSKQASSHRSKRGLRDWLMVPGTNWCGPSNTASKSHTSLGGFTDIDKCCRRHDRCRRYIPGMRRKYNSFNKSLFTLSHCRCDKRFRACLKMADTGPANLVGKLFFNVVQTNCFVLKPEKVCTKRSWWGKCKRFEFKKAAHVRRNSPY